MLVLGLSGSLRGASLNSTLLRAAGAELPVEDTFVEFDGLAAIPPYNEEHDGAEAPAEVQALRAAIAGADAVLIATPEYNGSIPGQLKNALDWASRPYGQSALGGKPVGVLGASMGQFGAKWAQEDLRRVLGIIGAAALERIVPVGTAHEAFDAEGNLVDPAQRAEVATLVAELRAAVAAVAAEAEAA
jgi:chromate reductase